MSFWDKIGEGFEDLLGLREGDKRRRSVEDARRKAEERYEKDKLDSSAYKKEYSEAITRNLQQQSGGFAAALAGQRGTNQALASHLASNTQAEMGAKAAGTEAMALEQIGYQTDIYNKELLQQEYQNALNEENYIAQGDENALSMIRNLVKTAATVGMTVAGGPAAGIAGNAAMAGQESNVNLAPDNLPPHLGGKSQGLGTSAPDMSYLSDNPYSSGLSDSNPKMGMSYYNHDFENDNSYHKSIASMSMNDHSDFITREMQKIWGEV